jgi:hypothetical protein
VTNTRDIIAKVLRRYPFVSDVDMPDELLTALAAAGKTIVDTPTEWEWGVRWPQDGPLAPVSWFGASEETVRRVALRDEGQAVRRRPTGEWEVAP